MRVSASPFQPKQGYSGKLQDVVDQEFEPPENAMQSEDVLRKAIAQLQTNETTMEIMKKILDQLDATQKAEVLDYLMKEHSSEDFTQYK